MTLNYKQKLVFRLAEIGTQAGIGPEVARDLQILAEILSEVVKSQPGEEWDE